jgi:beta-glucosidase
MTAHADVEQSGTHPRFPADFVWGVATAAYQIEGAVDEDGRGESIWDRFCATPGNVRGGDSGAVACDFYHRYPDDLGLVQELGVDALRLSVAWPRIVPEGRGAVNQKGLDFYDRLVDALLENGIAPYLTLYHWDLPQALEDRGGWTARETVEAFAEYAEVVVRRLGDRVSRWLTINEPWVVAWVGYGSSMLPTPVLPNAPGRTSQRDALAALHHLLMAHGRSVEIVRREAPGATVGIAVNMAHVYPASNSQRDLRAAAEADGHTHRWILDALYKGRYPGDMLDRFRDDLPVITDGDLRLIAAPTDFLAVNNYSRAVVAAAPEDATLTWTTVQTAGAQHTEMGWEVYPQGLSDLLIRIHNDYAPSRIYIGENGAAFSDVRLHDGSVNDLERTEYLRNHLSAVSVALDRGVPVAGYFVWSLLDNFEWAFGYSKRFGIVYIDYPTLERVPKGSYYWYQDFIGRQRNGIASRNLSAAFNRAP